MTDQKTPRLSPDADPLDPGFLRDLVTGDLRLTPEQSLKIYREMPIQELGRWADARCRSIHGDQRRTYVIDRNMMYVYIHVDITRTDITCHASPNTYYVYFVTHYTI